MVGTILSEQQETILAIIEEGHTWAEVADELGTSESNVEGQMRKIRGKQQTARQNLAANAKTLLLLDEGDHHRPYISNDERELLIEVLSQYDND